MRLLFIVIFIVSLGIIVYGFSNDLTDQTVWKVIVAISAGIMVSAILNIGKKRK